MITRDPGFPQLSIDTLLAQPEKQDEVRAFFAGVDTSMEQDRERGLLIDTVQNQPVAHYPAVITENGLLFELWTTERVVQPLSEVSIFEATREDVAASAMHLMNHDTKIKGSLLDLSHQGSGSVALSTVNTGWNRLDAIIRPGQIYEKAAGTLIMFGHQADATINEPIGALKRLSEAMTGLTGDEASQAQTQAMRELTKQGSYLLVVNFRQYKDEKDNPTHRLAYTGGLKSDAFWNVRKRVGFEL